jgi:hypothetical protein
MVHLFPLLVIWLVANAGRSQPLPIRGAQVRVILVCDALQRGVPL